MEKSIQYISLFVFTSVLFAGQPLNTDDAFSVGKKNIEIEILSEFYHYGNEREFSIPIGFSYGLFESTDIIIGGSYNSSWDASFTFSSIDDITVELKHIFVNGFFKIGIKPFVTLPTGDTNEGFGKGKVNYGTYLLITKEWQDFHIHTQFGYTRNNNIVGEKPDIWEYSIAAEKFISEDLSTVLEFGIAKNCCYEPVKHTKFILGGFIYQYNEVIAIDIGLMRGLSESDPNFGLMTGITIGL